MEEVLQKDNVIYHYTKAAVAINHILPHGQLKFSRLGDSGDPFEYKFWFLNTVAWGLEDELTKMMQKAHPAIDKLRRRDFRMISFCRNRETLLGSENQIKQLGCSKSRMWSQYAENHEGVCLAFNKDSLLHSMGKVATVYAEDTIYEYPDGSSARVLDGNKMETLGVEPYCLEHVKKHYRYFFFTKNPDYQDENEFRIIIHSESDSDIFVDISNSLVAIIIGDRFPDGYLPSLKYIAEGLNVKCRRLYWYHGEPYLVPCRPMHSQLKARWEGFEIS